MLERQLTFIFFFFNDTATTEIYTLSLHDALPISIVIVINESASAADRFQDVLLKIWVAVNQRRSEEHTSELQSQSNLVCRLLLEKKKKDSLSLDAGRLFERRKHFLRRIR